MTVPFVSFLPMEKELGDKLKEAFDRVMSNSWYIRGQEDETFEKASLEDMKNLRKVLKDLQLDLERTGYNESFLRNHLGEYIVLKWLEKNKDFADKNSKDAEEFFTHFNNIFSYISSIR